MTLCRSASPSLGFRPFLRLSLCLPVAWCFGDVTEVVWTSGSLSIGCLSLSCWVFFFFFHQSGAGSEKAVHLSIAGAEHHVPVNTRPLATLSHLVSSPRLLFSADISQILKKKFEKLPRQRTWSLNGLSGGKSLWFFSLQMGHFVEIYPKNVPTTITVFILNAVRSRLFMPLVGSELKNNINKPRRNRSFSGHGSSRIFTRRPENLSSSNTPECPSLQLQPVIAESHLCLYLSLDSPEQDFNSHSESRVQTDM